MCITIITFKYNLPYARILGTYEIISYVLVDSLAIK